MNNQPNKIISKKWNKLSLIEQIANIGSEVERAISWKNRGNKQYSQLAFERALVLLEATINCVKNKKRLKELTRIQETLVDYFAGKNQYHSSDELWRKYFLSFNYYTRRNS